MGPASFRFGGRNHKSVSGPMDWVPPGATAPIRVYERLNDGKRQLFALTNEGTGLGRVLDSRYRMQPCAGEVKFPLGYWRDGEVRDYRLACGRETKPLKVTIEHLDFVYEGVPHSLRFHWLINEGQGRATNMRYTYSPLRGLVRVEGNE